MTIRRPISIDVPSVLVDNDAKALNTLAHLKETLKSHVSYRALEPRIVFDAAVVATVATVVDTHTADAATVAATDAQAAVDAQHNSLLAALEAQVQVAAAVGAVAPVDAATSHSVTFVDADVGGLSTLLASVPASSEIVMLDRGRDGLQQMADYLANKTDLDAIHVLSHGDAGELILGGVRFSSSNIEEHAAALAVIGHSLSANGDILLYGCDVAAGVKGGLFVDDLARLTGADVAASTNDTGTATHGGDWNLETRSGLIEAGLIDAPEWNGILAPLVISTTAAPTVVGLGGVGTTSVWANAGFIGSTAVDLRATVITFTPGFAGATTPLFGTVADNPYVQLTQLSTVTLRWEIFQAGTTTAATGAPNWTIKDIDGIGGVSNTRESAAPSAYNLQSYTFENLTNLVISGSGTTLQASGTQDQASEPNSAVVFRWSDVQSWDITYRLWINDPFIQARFEHDGDGDFAFVNPITVNLLAVDLDANNSTATGTGYQNSFSGTPVAIVDTDVSIIQHTVLGTTIDSAHIILSNAQAGDELLVSGSNASSGTVNGLTYSIATTGGQITITLSGNATPAAYDVALKDITYRNTLSTPNAVDRLITVGVANATFGTFSNEALSTIHVLLNDAPVNTLAASYTINEDLSLNLTGISVADVDAGTAPVSVTFNVASGNLTLSTVAAGGIVAADVAGNGTDTIVITASIAKINATLLAVGGLKFQDVLNHNGLVTLTMTTNDLGNSGLGGALSDVDTRTITVTAVNDAPVALDDTFVADQAVALIIPVKINDSDFDSAVLTVTKIGTLTILPGGLAVAVTNGSVKLLLDGTLQFTGSAGYVGPISFTYTLSDGLLIDTATVTGTIIGVPNAADDAFYTTQDMPITFSVLANDTDLSFPLTLTEVAGQPITAGDPAGVAVTGGVVTLDAAGKLTFTPDTGYLGLPVFTYTVDDGHGRTDIATITGSVTPLNHDPVNVVPGDQLQTGASMVFSVANGNAIQVTDDASAIQIIQTTISATSGTLTLSQLAGLTFLTGDGIADATITLKGTKAAINAALDGLIYTKVVGATTTATITILTNDLGHPDGEDIPNGSFETTLVPLPAGGQVITLETNVPGWRTTATDHMIELWGTGFLGVPAYEGIHFAELNAFQAAADFNTATIPKGQPLEFSFAHRGRSGTDVMNVTVQDAGADGLFGTADDTTLMNQNYSDGNTAWGFYQKDLGVASGNPIRLIFTSISSVGGATIGNFLDAVHLGTKHLTDTDTVLINFNTPPVALNDTAAVNEDISAIIPVRGNDSDFNGDPLTVTAVTQGAHGTVSIDVLSGNPVYTPATNYVGADTFTYTISDGKGGVATATVSVTIAPINDAPAGTDKTVTAIAGSAITLTAADFGFTDPNDAPANTLTGVKISALPVNGTLTDDGIAVLVGQVVSLADITTGKLVFTPDAAGTTPATLTFQVQDSGGILNAGVDLDQSPNTLTFNRLPLDTSPHLDLSAETVFVTGGPGTGAFLFGHQQGLAIDRNLPSFAVAPANVTQVVGNEIAGAGIAIDYSQGTHAAITGVGSTSLVEAVTASDYISMSFTTTSTMPESWITNVTKLNAGGPNYQFAIVISTDGFQTGTLLSKDNASPSAGSPNNYASGYPNFDGTDFKLVAGQTYEVRAYLYSAVGGAAATVKWDDFYVFFANDPAGNVTTFTEGGTPVSLTAPGSEIEDVDSANMTGGIVTLTNKQVSDRLLVSGTPVTTGSTGTIGGIAYTVLETSGDVVISLSGTATKAAYTAALSAITFENTSDDPVTIDRTVTATVTDGVLTSNTAVTTIHVIPVNDAPVATGEIAGTTEDTTLTVVASPATGLLVNDTDVDGGALSITQFTVAGVTGIFTAGQSATIANVGVLTIDGDGGYSFVPDSDYNGTVPVATYTVSDGAGGTTTATLALTVTPITDTIADSVIAQQDTPFTFNVLTGTNGASADNFEGAPVVSGVSSPSHGSVIFAADGTLIYTPDAGYHGADSFTYTVTSPAGVTETGVVTVAVNAPPEVVVSLGDKTGLDGNAVLIATKGAFSDPDGDAMTFSATGLPAGLSINPVTGRITGTLTADASVEGPISAGQYEVTVTATDTRGGSVPETFTFRANNIAPLAVNDSGTTLEDISATLDVLANDHDGGLDADTLHVSAIDGHALSAGGAPVQVANGDVSLDLEGRVVFRPALDFTGTTSFSYTVSDNQGGTATASVLVDVIPVNDTPVIAIRIIGNGDVIVVDGAIPNVQSLLDALPANVTIIVIPADVDGVRYLAQALDGLSNITALHILSHGEAGDLTLGTSHLTTQSIATYYKSKLGDIGQHLTYNGDILIYGCNFGQDLAAVGALSAATHADVAASIDNTGSVALGGNWSLEASSGLIEAISIAPLGWDGLLAPQNTGVWTIAGTSAVDSSTGITTTIKFTPVSANTSFTALTSQTFNTINAFNSASVQGAASLGFIFAWDTTPEVVTSAASTDAGTGTVTITFSKPVTDPIINLDKIGGAGGLIGSPTSNSSLWTLTSGGTLTKLTGANHFNVTATQVFRTIGDASTGAESSLATATGTAAGSFRVNGTFTTLTFSLTGTGIEGGGNDGMEIGLTLNVNQAPTVSATTYTTPEDTAKVLTGISFADPDATTANVTVTLSVAHGTLDINTAVVGGITAAQVTGDLSGTITITASLSAINATLANATGLTYTPVLNYNGSDLLTANINDLGNTGAGGPLNASATAAITITPVNDAPVAVADTGTIAEDTTLTVAASPTTGLLANDTDVDGNALAITQFAVAGVAGTFAAGTTAIIPSVGSLKINTDGSYSFIPVLNFNGDVPVATYTVSDGAGGLANSTLTITVTPVNDPPVAVNDTKSVPEDGPAATGNVITGPGIDTDVDGNSLTVVSAVQGVTPLVIGTPFVTAGGGTLTLAADGSYTFAPGTAYNGLDTGETATETVTYTIADGNGGTAIAALVITINGANDTPVIIDPANPGTLINPIPATDPLNIIADVATTDGAPLAPINVGLYVVDPDGEPLVFTLSPAAPAWLIIDPATGIITGTPPADASQLTNTGTPGEYLITITATDPDGALVTTTVTLTIVNLVPVAINDTNAIGEDVLTVSGNVLSDPLTGDYDTAPDSDPLTVVSALQGATPLVIGAPFVTAGGGTLTLAADGSYTFAPGTAYNGLDTGETATETVSYTIADGNGGTAIATLVITINGANDAPVIIDPANPGTLINPIPATDPLNIIADVATTDGAPLAPINVGLYVVDPDGEPLVFTLSPAAPAWLIIDPATGIITGTPPADASQLTNTGVPGEYLITITATDPDGALVTTTVTLTIVNLAPVAINDTNSVGEDVLTVAGNVLSDPLTGDADTAPDSDPLTVVSAMQGVTPLVIGAPFVTAGGGTLTLAADGSYTFAPGTAYNGLDTGETATETVTYTIADGNGGTAIATLVITINGANDAPVIIDPSNLGTAINPIPATDPLNIIADVATTDGAPLAPINVGLYVVDPDGEPLVFTVGTTTPAWIVIDPATGIITGTPPADASQLTNTGVPGEYLITITATDPDGALVTTTVTLTIVNLVPVAVNDTNSVGEDTASVAGNVLTDPLTGDHDTAPDSDPLTVVSAVQGVTPLVIGAPFVTAGGGTLTLAADGSYTFAPGTAYNGLDTGETATETVSYTIADGNGGTAIATLVITINGANDAPVIIDPSNPGTAINPIQATDPLNIILDVATTDGAALLPINVGLYVVDPDGEPLTFTVGTTTPTWIIIDPATGIITGTPPADASQLTNTGTPGEYLITITATDPDGALVTTTVTLTIVNLVPVAINDTNAIGEDGLTVSGNVLSDPLTGDADTAPDSDPLTVVSALQGVTPIIIGTSFVTAGGGTLTLAADGSYTFAPGTAYNGLDTGETATETVTYTIADGNGGTAIATLVITINGANDAPEVINPVTGLPISNPTVTSIIPGISVSDASPMIPVPVGGFFRDADTGQGPPVLSVNAATLPLGIEFNPTTGTFTGTPSSDASQGHTPGDPAGTYCVPVTATDPLGASVTTYVTFTIANLAPVAHDEFGATKENVGVTLNVLANDRDPDGDALRVALATSAQGTVVINADGTLRFTPKPGFAGLAYVTYVITDDQGGTSTATVTVDVKALSFAPQQNVSRTPAPQPVFNHQSVTANGAIIEAISGRDGASVAASLGEHDVVRDAVMSEPGFNPLRGEGLATEGAVLQESLRLQRLWHLDEVHPGGSSFDTWRASGMAASSLVFGEDASSQGHGNRSNVNIEARVLNGVLTLWATRVLGSKTVADVNYRMTLVDGRPLPARLDRTAKDQVSGRRPANVESIDIRVIAVMPDGREVLQDVRVNLKTGDIEPIARRDASLAPRMFSSQFRAMEPIGASGREALARVLAK